MNTAIENLFSLNESEDNYFTISDTIENRQAVLDVINNLVDIRKADDWRNSRRATGYLENYYFDISWFPAFTPKKSKLIKNPVTEAAHFNIRYTEYNPELTVEEIKIVQRVKAMDWTYQYAEGPSYYAGCRQEGEVSSLLRKNSSLPTERKRLIFKEAGVNEVSNFNKWAFVAFGLSA